MTDDLRQRIDDAIRPNMLLGLQGAELFDAPGTERIGEWADWISQTVAELIEPKADAPRRADQGSAVTDDGLRKAHADLKRVEQERAQLPEEERQRLEAADAPLLRIQLLHMLERARKAERAADLLADSHRRAEQTEAENARLRNELETRRERWKAGLQQADKSVRDMTAEMQRYATGEEAPVMWSVYNQMHLRAANAEADLTRVRIEIRAIQRDVRGKNPVALAGLREAAARIEAVLPKERQ